MKISFFQEIRKHIALHYIKNNYLLFILSQKIIKFKKKFIKLIKFIKLFLFLMNKYLITDWVQYSLLFEIN